ncbi:MAG: GC-type dockerin domain-anchored protein [Phycisphaerales bacterium]
MRARWFAVVSAAIITPLAHAQAITQALKVTSPSPGSFDFFGSDVTIEGGRLLVGAQGDRAAYFYPAPLDGSPPSTVRYLGSALWGFTIGVEDGVIVGAARVANGAGGSSSDAIVTFDASTLVPTFELLPDANSGQTTPAASLGLDGGLLVVGNPGEYINGNASAGAAYLYDTATGARLHKFVPSGPETNGSFGRSVGISNGVVAIGSYKEDTAAGVNSGAILLYDAVSGDLLRTITPDGAAQLYFGDDVAIDGDIVVGIGHDNTIYTFDVSTGQQIASFQVIEHTNTETVHAMALQGGRLAVGVGYGDGAVVDSGVVYLFDPTTGEQLFKMYADDGEAGVSFGVHVAMEGDLVAVGAQQDDDAGTNAGAVYLFDLGPCNAADLTGGGMLNLDDVNLFAMFFIAQDPRADVDGNGVLNLDDVNTFAIAFTAGCP